MESPRGSEWLHRLAMATAGATFLLIIAGALVVGHDAGLSVPDWPLSFGKFMPPMEGGVFYEHGHRMIAALVAALTAVLAIWLWGAEVRKSIRWLGLAAFLAVILQAVLGGLTVLYLLPIPVLVAHACLAQLFFCFTLSLAVYTSPACQSASHPAIEDLRFPSFRHLSSVTTAGIFVQLILGAARRHKALGLAPHLVWAGVLSVLILSLLFLALNRLPLALRTLRSLSMTAAILLAVQLSLGFESYRARLAAQSVPQPDPSMIWITTAHVAVGALLLGVSLILTLLAYRELAVPGKSLSFSQSPQKTLA